MSSARAEAAGLVCLPAAGNRDGTFIDSTGGNGYYWSSSADEDYDAYLVLSLSDYVYPAYAEYREYGCSVRLVTDY